MDSSRNANRPLRTADTKGRRRRTAPRARSAPSGYENASCLFFPSCLLSSFALLSPFLYSPSLASALPPLSCLCSPRAKGCGSGLLGWVEPFGISGPGGVTSGCLPPLWGEGHLEQEGREGDGLSIGVGVPLCTEMSLGWGHSAWCQSHRTNSCLSELRSVQVGVYPCWGLAGFLPLYLSQILLQSPYLTQPSRASRGAGGGEGAVCLKALMLLKQAA